jgi:hypothetical protein
VVAGGLSRGAVLTGQPVTQMPVLDQGGKNVHDHPGAEERGDVGMVVRRGDLDEIHPDEPLAGGATSGLESLAGVHATGVRRSRAGRGVRHVRERVDARERGVQPAREQRDVPVPGRRSRL